MLTRRLAAGAGLLLATSILGRFLALASQVVTGAVLSDDDFGVYAVAIGLQTIAGLTRGGDAQNYLVTLPPSGRRRRVGTVFVISLILYLVGVVPILIVAPAQAEQFEQPILVPLLWVLCIALLTSPIRYVVRARVNARLNFRQNAIGSAIGAVVNYGLMVVLAVTLRNPLSLAIPVLVGWLAEIAYLWRVARPTWDDFIPQRRFVLPVVFRLRGLIAVSAMISIWTSGDYLLASYLVPTAVLGTYYFGYQLAVQPGRLFSTTLMNVLVPVVCRVMGDRTRLAAALHRLLGAGGLSIAVLNMALVAVISSIERIMWNGRWADAVFTVQVLSIGLIFSGVLGILTSPFLAERRYREAFICNLLRAIGLVLGVLAGTMAFEGGNGLASCVAVSLAVSSIGTTAWVLSRYGIDPVTGVVHLLRCTIPVIAAGCLGAVFASLTTSTLGDDRLSAVGGLFSGGLGFLLGALLVIPVIPRSVRTEFLSIIRSRTGGGRASA